ncbi:hypothetical protein [Micromonospora sp. M61]|uniref:hypothetical protein n=1 Tax=Micromonospora sp. M61 TaxID=2824890 RepID=UPI001B3960D3|nr:hypothetical protein [Micromonospora sp. M61]MBQ0977866.1 hypothetical protein [Micromonospora sp. M61]
MVIDKAGLATLCDLLCWLAHMRLTPEQASEAQALITAARRGEYLGDRLVTFAAQFGVPLEVGHLRGGNPGTLMGATEHVSMQIYACPAGECSRRWIRRPGRDIPLCVVSGRQLHCQRS